MNKHGLSCLLALFLASPAAAQETMPTGGAYPVDAPAPEIIAPLENPAPHTEITRAASPSGAPTTDLIDDAVISLIREKVNTELTFFMINNQNEKYQGYDEQKINELDAQWVAERKADSKPLIAATLSNPLSSYLTMVQAHSEGLFTELFVMDNKGLNVGQSNISSDYWQGDEAKWQKTFLVAPNAVFIDEAEFDDERKIWVVQTNLAIADPETGVAIGAVTVDINLTELQRRRQTGAAL